MEFPDIPVPVLVALFVALVGLWTWSRTNRWKRREYVLKAFQDRYDSPGAKNASLLLYWADRHIPLWADDEPNRWERVNDEQAAQAILPYCIHPFDFTDMEWKAAKRRIALNDSFVDLIWRLDQVRVVAAAAHPNDIREVIHEVGEILSGNPRAERLAPPNRLVPRAFRLMIAFRGMRDLTNFFDQSGYDIRYTAEDHEALKAAFPELDWHKLTFEEVARRLADPVSRRKTLRQRLFGSS